MSEEADGSLADRQSGEAEQRALSRRSALAAEMSEAARRAEEVLVVALDEGGPAADALRRAAGRLQAGQHDSRALAEAGAQMAACAPFAAGPTGRLEDAAPWLPDLVGHMHAEIEARGAAEPLRRAAAAAAEWADAATDHIAEAVYLGEEFMARYRPQRRKSAGFFCTPQPVAACMAKLADEAARAVWGLPDGIADPASWEEAASRSGFAVPDGVSPDSQFVSMIDPATGTGAFLLAWMRQARRASTSDVWAKRLEETVLPSMSAAEILLPAWAAARMLTAAEARSAGADPAAGPRVVLADALAAAPGDAPQLAFAQMQAQDGGPRCRPQDDVLRAPVTVVIGNPPYLDQPAAARFNGPKPGGIVTNGAPGIAPLIEDIAAPMRAAGQGRHLKRIYNDFVYFWRWAIWRAVESPPGPGMVALVVPSSSLAGPSMGGLRRMIRQSFDRLWVVDLGGDARSAEDGGNVFGVRTPTAIMVAASSGRGPSDSGCDVRYLRLDGSAASKLGRLSGLSIADVSERVPGASFGGFKPGGGGDYPTWPLLTDLFPWSISGCQAKRMWPIGETAEVLEARWAAFTEAPLSARGEMLHATVGRTLQSVTLPLPRGQADGTVRPITGPLPPLSSLAAGDPHDGSARYGWRSFDRQWVIADSRLLNAPKAALWQASGPRQVYLSTLTSLRIGPGPAVTATPYIPDIGHFRGIGGARDTMPLYTDSAGERPNVAEGLLAALSARWGCSVQPEDLLAYVYGVAGTGAFEARFCEHLRAPGPPRIPVTACPDAFGRAAALGRYLLHWHTWGERFAPQRAEPQPEEPPSAAVIAPITAPPPTPRSVVYDPDDGTLTVGDGQIGPVSRSAWEFAVTGMRVIRSWAGRRAVDGLGRRTSPLDAIRPATWAQAQTEDLLAVVEIAERTTAAAAEASRLLADICSGPLFRQGSLPTPSPHQKRAPRLETTGTQPAF